MHWIAPSEKDTANAALEKRRWDAADQFHANSSLKSQEYSIHGVEKTDETGRLCRLHLAVHGLEGEIKHGGNINSYYDDPHDATGRFDFVLANPPINVNAVDKERLKDMVGPGHRFPFGLPRTDNVDYPWIQLSYSAPEDGKPGTSGGKAGLVMANFPLPIGRGGNCVPPGDKHTFHQGGEVNLQRFDQVPRLLRIKLMTCRAPATHNRVIRRFNETEPDKR